MSVVSDRAQAGITLGILAGGQATRLGGLDKAWLRHAGQPQVLRLARRLETRVERILVSANRDLARFSDAGLETVVDRVPGIGPLAGLDALARACTTDWLLTLPVDLVSTNDCLLQSLVAAGSAGAWVEDDDGKQPLVALWPLTPLQRALVGALASDDHSVQSLQRRLGMARVRLEGVRLGNLNTPQDLDAAGIAPDVRRTHG